MAENNFSEGLQVHRAASHGPEEAPLPQEDGYLGSVRFFKHLILTVLALAIVVPTVLSVILGISLRLTKAELSQVRQSAGQLQQALLENDLPDEPGELAKLTDAPQEPPEKNEGPAPERPAYQDLYPDLYAQPAERNSVDVEKVVYLSFDDGPSERTAELLEILECYGVKATFFVTGKRSGTSMQRLRNIAEAGHTIGVHSYTHDYDTIYSSVEAYLEDFAQEYYVIQEATGTAPQIFRFPGGSVNAYNGHIYQEIIGEMTRRGFVYFDWNRQIGDAVRGSTSPQKLVDNALERASSMRRIFLLAHDNTRLTNVVEALPKIIEGYQAEGFSFAALTPEVKPVVYDYPI